MTKYTQKQLREMVIEGVAVDLTQASAADMQAAKDREDGWIDQIGYASGIYGCNGQLWRGHKTGTLYAITARTTNIYRW